MITAITACYGQTHAPYARVLIESLRRVGGARTVLVHADLDLAPFTWVDVRVPIDLARVQGDRTTRVARKLAAWEAGLTTCANGDRVAFLDADTIALRALDGAFARPFDVAHTLHAGRRWSVNSGVVFARVSDRVRAWIADWRALAEWILTDPDRVQRAVDRWGAADQAALVAALRLHDGYDGLVVAQARGEVWNEEWESADFSNVAIWHLKGLLPVLVEGQEIGAADPRHAIVQRWRTVAQEIGVIS
ncbi:MAG: hypothetical protein Q8S13_03990 [Dehalococcoidia bacterium]|nr:hypothetical protein [Dehalococcoidia bacterium]